MPSPSEIASTGQSEAQAPQEMQASVILYAIVTLLLLILKTPIGFFGIIVTYLLKISIVILIFYRNFILYP
jgi:hypothetical protein